MGFKLSRKAKNRLTKLAGVVKRNHKHFDMGSWCGVQGCIAGFAIVEFDKKVFPSHTKGLEAIDTAAVYQEAAKRHGYNLNDFSYSQWAAKVLDLPKGMSSSALFVPGGWPQEFSDRFYEANGTKEEAKIAAERLLHLVKTGE